MLSIAFWGRRDSSNVPEVILSAEIEKISSFSMEEFRIGSEATAEGAIFPAVTLDAANIPGDMPPGLTLWL